MYSNGRERYYSLSNNTEYGDIEYYTITKNLENLGLKVFLTRDGTEDENENTAYNMYDDDGRITIAMESHAKIFISLHMNSNEACLDTGGVEVYVPDNLDLTFAELLADNIVTMANTNYSANKYYNSNVGLESYLVELGYMSVSEDLYNVLNNSDSYMEAIAESIKTYY